MTDFKKAIAIVIREHEGGFQNREDDPGNYDDKGVLRGTKYGISASAFPGEDIENLTLERAVELYEKVWGRFAVLDNQLVLTKVLDLAVNWQWGHKGPATKALQRACGAEVDGIFGPKTAAAANAADWYELLRKLCIEAHDYYHKVETRNPGMRAWFGNWEHRASWLPPKESDVGTQVSTVQACAI